MKEAFHANLIEEALSFQPVQNGTLTLKIGPYSIETYLINKE